MEASKSFERPQGPEVPKPMDTMSREERAKKTMEALRVGSPEKVSEAQRMQREGKPLTAPKSQEASWEKEGKARAEMLSLVTAARNFFGMNEARSNEELAAVFSGIDGITRDEVVAAAKEVRRRFQEEKIITPIEEVILKNRE